MAEEYVSTGIEVTFVEDSADVFACWLLDVSLSGEEADQVEVTHQASADNRKEFLSGLIDGGEATFACLFDPDATVPTPGAQGTLTIAWPDGTTKGWQATANVKKVGEVSGALGDKMTTEIVFKITGKPDYAHTPSSSA